MTHRASLLALTAALAAAACDPLAGIDLRTALRPAPATTCVENALKASSLVDDVVGGSPSAFERREEQRIYSVHFRDGSGRGYGNVLTDAQADSVLRVSMGFHWIGSLAQEPAESRQSFVTGGTALLRELQAACGRGAPAPIECRQIDFGKSGPCSGTSVPASS